MGRPAFQSDDAGLPDERGLSAGRPLDPERGRRRTQSRRGLPHLRSVHVSDQRPRRAGARHRNPPGDRSLQRPGQLHRVHVVQRRIGGHAHVHLARLQGASQGAVDGVRRRQGDRPRRLQVADHRRRKRPGAADASARERAEGGARMLLRRDRVRRRLAHPPVGTGAGDARGARHRAVAHGATLMCGIVGSLVFDNGSFAVTEPYIRRMRDTMTHRGPDGAGVWVSDDGRVGLGHRRLSIIDLSAVANQPMSNEDGSLQVVFNGEIYNHAEIRKELEATGAHRWKTNHSDTEVVLHAFEQWGIDCLHRFRGMFAIALWDARQRQLWLIRDRIGVKPLYYSVHHGRITFASEIKALLADPGQHRDVNESALYHYLSFLTTPAPETLFEGIGKVPGGSWLRVDGTGAIREHRYWDAWDNVTPLTGVDEREVAERVLAELRTAVNLRKVSDVPVGVFLSGGIDSSTNAKLFS